MPRLIQSAGVLVLGLACLISGCQPPNGGPLGRQGPNRDAEPQPAARAEAPKVEKKEDEANTDRLKLPSDGGVWPWPLSGASPPMAALPVSLPALSPGTRSVTGAAVNPAVGKAVVILHETDFKQRTSASRLLWCDLPSGRITLEWELPKRYCAPFDLHADGRQLLVRRPGIQHAENETLELWTITADGQLQQRTWMPHWALTGKKDARSYYDKAVVRWAGFAGRDHIVSVCEDGELHVWERASLRRVGSFMGVLGFPAVTPDGRLVAFVTGENIALLDPLVGEIIAARRIGTPPENPVLAFHPEGHMLACAGKGRAAILDLKTGQLWDAMLAEMSFNYHGLLPDFGWAGDKHLYVNGELFDLHTPIPVWRYISGPHWAAPRGRSVWVIAQALGEKETALRSFELPHADALAAMDAALRKPGLFALRPGDAVRIDVSGLPDNRQREVQATLERRVTGLGYRLDASAPVAFLASEDKVATPRRVTYTFENRKVTATYPERMARLKIVKNGKQLWEGQSCDAPPFLVMVPHGVAPEDRLSQYGSPDYDLFSKRPLPGVIRGENNNGPLGESELSAEGVRDKNWRVSRPRRGR